ncbi:hypothetical protein [Emticicia oligotrophica]|uniref:hypothetical protein n=1 Tax=Emticicia oligotrophica TaxID=312279 RepID=UPI00273CBB3C|nr:hypothetical protein [Emticicia oligotrophica]
MGYDVALFPKTRNSKIIIKIIDCEEQYKIKELSRTFSMFQSRNFEGCELKQVEKILQIDLSAYWSQPINFQPNLYDLEYQLLKFEEKEDNEGIDLIKKAIENERLNWKQNYDNINEGWVELQKFKSTTSDFLQRIKGKPNFGSEIKVLKDWDYHWYDYFFSGCKNNIEEDLISILKKLECYEENNIKFVALIGGY